MWKEPASRTAPDSDGEGGGEDPHAQTGWTPDLLTEGESDDSEADDGVLMHSLKQMQVGFPSSCRCSRALSLSLRGVLFNLVSLVVCRGRGKDGQRSLPTHHIYSTARITGRRSTRAHPHYLC
jgi:hypothetical protein